jgi:hypothetical protein
MRPTTLARSKVRYSWWSVVGAVFRDPPDSRLLSRRRRPVGRFSTELLGVLSAQPLPAAEIHRLATSDAADGVSAEKTIQNIETNVPPGSAHCDEAVTDVGPQRQTRAATKGFELPSHIEATPFVFKRLRSLGSRHGCFGNARRRRSDRGEFHRASNRTRLASASKGAHSRGREKSS